MTPLLWPRRYPALWCTAGLLAMAVIAIGSLLPSAQLPQASWLGQDKVNHVVGHGLLSAYAALLFATPRARFMAAMALMAYGIGIEWAQQALPTGRTASAADVVANAVGVLLGQGMARTRWHDLLARLDARLAPEHRP